MLQIRERSAVLYYQAETGEFPSEKRRTNMLTIRKTRYVGEMTSGARKRFSKCLSLMAQANKARFKFNPATGRMQWHHLTHLTLTISSSKNLSGREAYDQLLNHFLDWLTRTKGVKGFTWKGELQERGQPHYHLVFPDLIHYKEIRNKWNQLQRKAGLLDEYAKKHGHFNAPSTDIRKVQHVKNIVSYLMKELGKSVDAHKVKITAQVDQDIKDGKLDECFRHEEIRDRLKETMSFNSKVWGASMNLTSGKFYSIPMQLHHNDALVKLNDEGKIRMKGEDDFWKMFIFQANAPPLLLNEFELRMFNSYIQKIWEA